MDTKSSEAQYMSGFGNEFQTEAISGALPKGQNNPQRCPMDLFAEQLSGSAFTRDRAHNLRSWLYRIRPSVVHGEFEAEDLSTPPLEPLISTFTSLRGDPNQLRWDPLPLPSVEEEIDFVDGLVTVAGSGAASEKSGVAIHLFTANISMRNKAFVNSDGYLLLVLQQGNLSIQTELGYLELSPKEICVIPRGIVFRVELSTECPARGYILETFSGPFELPNLGPLGANGLANPRDFLYPVAAYDLECDNKFEVVNKFCGTKWKAKLQRSPFDVVAWHGNYAPYKYNLELFNTMGTISYDHPDPSIFTVLTCPSSIPGEAVADFAIFPPRWMVAEQTFRPPYFHRNVMSEFMGMIYGCYDAKEGFRPGMPRSFRS
mmetsp:Transcript_33082/g.51557  ORF Transcript_33082/g.51557 Transcript_33082/m.51557 type:complete len:374 (-) Transcript_33082:500-1621(-)